MQHLTKSRPTAGRSQLCGDAVALGASRTFGVNSLEARGAVHRVSENFVNVDRETPMLLPADLRQWVPEDDLMHFVGLEKVRIEWDNTKIH